MKPVSVLLLCTAALVAADPVRLSEKEVVQMARKSPNSPELQSALRAAMKDGKGVIGYMGDFVFAIESKTPPTLKVNGAAVPKLQHLKNSDLWIALAPLKTGWSHNYSVTVDGKTTPPADFAAFGEGSYEKPGVPQGKLSPKIVHTSRIYDGMKSDYWVYTSANYDPKTPAALLVVQDGTNYARRDSSSRILTVIDNLTAEKKMPPSVVVMIAPGLIGERRMRSIQYDSVDDTYARFLRDEVIKDVESNYNVRKDGYSRAIMGESSGAICAFTVAWFDTDRYARVFSRIGTYTSIQWQPWKKEGGNIYPFLLRKSPRKNIRVWLQDGSNDLENDHGSWPLQNIQMANSMKMKGYDFKFTFGTGQHNTQHGNAQMPEALTWLWRGYDPAKTSEEFVMDPAEKDKPYWRVTSLNRD